MTRQCCMCQRYARGEEWILQAKVAVDNVTHTYCPVCFEQERARIRAHHRRRKPVSQPLFGF